MGVSNIVKLYDKLKNDFSEQKNEIIIKNLSGKRRIRYGGLFIYEEDGFIVNTNFDFENYHLTNGPLILKILDEKSFEHLSRFWNKLHTSDNLIWYKDYEVYSIRDKIKNKEEIKISNSIIDNNVIKFLAKFKCLKELKFSYCNISKSCNFSELNNLNIEIDNCNIETFDVFSMSNNNLTFNNSTIEKIGHGFLYSEKLQAGCFTPDQINILLLSWNFPNLRYLNIKYNSNNNISYDLKYLTKAALKLTELSVLGKVKSMKFLLGMNQMIECSILSNSDEFGLFIPEISDDEERKMIKEKYKDEVEIKRILDESDYQFETDFSAVVQYIHFLKTCEFYKKISYSDQEKISLMSSFITNYFKYVQSQQFPKLDAYYKAIGDDLKYKIVSNATKEPTYYSDKIKKYWELQDSIGNGFEIVDNYDMIHFEREFIYKKMPNTKIVKGIPYLYYIDGHPIELIYNKPVKKISSIEEALEHRKELPRYERLNNFEYAIKHIKKLDYRSNLSFNLILETLNECYSISFSIDDLNQFKEYLQNNCEDINFITKCIDIKIKRNQQIEKLKKKIYDYYLSFINILLDNYELFNNKEKKAILTLLIKKDYLDGLTLGYESNYSFSFNSNDESKYIEENEYLINETLNEINNKTNGQYQKFITMLDKYISLYKTLYSYDIDIPEEEFNKIKKLK